MSEEELRRRASIEFWKPLDVEDSRSLLANLPTKIDCTVNYQERITRGVFLEYGCRPVVVDRPLHAEISGQLIPGVKYIEEGCILAPFEFFRDDIVRSFMDFSGIRFFVAPGYDMGDVSRGELRIFDDVRKVVHDYLSNDGD